MCPPLTSRHRSETEPSAPLGDPERVGAYPIPRRLGEGGMGVVYLAARDDGAYQHEVAVKVLKGGSQAAALARRFRRERQALFQSILREVYRISRVTR